MDNAPQPVVTGAKIREKQVSGISTNLANVNVITLLVDLRVVEVENGRVGSSSLGNTLAGVVSNNNVSGSAVLALISKAKLLSGE